MKWFVLFATLAIVAQASLNLERTNAQKAAVTFLSKMEHSHIAVMSNVASADGDVEVLSSRLGESLKQIRKVKETVSTQANALVALDWRLAADMETATADDISKTWMRAQATFIVALSEVRSAVANASSPWRSILPYLDPPPVHPVSFGDWTNTNDGLTAVARLLHGTFIKNACSSSTCSLCLNNGICQQSFGQTTCKCPMGFTGNRCEINVDDCVSNPCKNGGLCLDRVNDFKCSCAPGWTGKRCGKNIDDCLSAPCKNGGKCKDGINSFTCRCPAGYAGADCSVDINECASNPCENDGICIDLVNSFMCKCAAGFSGKTCKTNIDDCAPNPCKNGGKCADGVNKFTCNCAPGFNGKKCGKNIDDCASSPCKNGGQCADGINSFTCKCPLGFTGPTCAIDIDDCASSPCKNGASCVDGTNSYTCKCAAGFKGRNCGIDIDDCASNPCKNGAGCKDKVNAYECACKTGFNGTSCEINVDDCLSSPCASGATCVDGIASFSCTCPPGFSGPTCSTEINECDKAPCKNDGICVHLTGSYKCTCPPGFQGSNCETGVKCAEPENVAFAIFTVTNKGQYPSELTYKCNNGYTSADSLKRSCSVDGTWSGKGPTCTGIVCQVPSNIQFGTVTTTNGGLFPSTASYACSPGYATADPTLRTCGVDGSWSGKQPVCVGIAGAPLSPPPFGSVKFSNDGKYPSTATYACDTGYATEDPLTRLVAIDGTWGGKEPVCKPVTCASLPAAQFGTVTTTNGNMYPSNAVYTCSSGYRTTDPLVRVCNPDGSWTGAPPTCVGIPCAPLTAVPSAQVTFLNTGRFPDTATYKCDDGFSSADALTRTCLADGSWSGTAPRCAGNTCQSLPAIAFGTVKSSNSNKFPSKAAYTCNDGFSTTDPTSRDCLPDGSWSGVAPTCQGVVCATLSKPDTASIQLTNGGRFPATATYVCDAGFATRDAPTRTCNADGSWSGKEPTCRGIRCNQIPLGSLYTFTTTNNNRFPSTATYTCNAGFSTADPAVRTCNADGTWAGLPPSCLGAPCASLPPPPSGSFVVSNGGRYPSVATYSCDNGYTTSDPVRRRCKPDGTWSGSQPNCQGQLCAVLANIPFGQLSTTNNNRFPSTASYKCLEGYATTDPAVRTCDTSGSWSGSTPTCKGVKCAPMPEFPNGFTVISNSNRYPAKVTYTCNAGFTLSGAPSRDCKSDGSWDSASPTCTPNAVKPLDAIPNGNVIVSSSVFPATATYSCNPGFQISGSSTRVANPEGTWAGRRPKCQPIACNPPVPPTNGAVKVNQPTYPATATYECMSGFNLVGSSTAQCTASGGWTGVPPTCNGNTCPAPAPVAFGTITTTSPIFPSTATYTCKTGLALTGDANRKCAADGTWSGMAPTCGCLAPPKVIESTVSVVNTATGNPTVATYKCNDKFMLLGNPVVACSIDGTWPVDLPQCVSKNSCKANPCKNLATCSDKAGPDYECKCVTAFFQGKDCETELDYLSSSGISTMIQDQYVRSAAHGHFLYLSPVGTLTLFTGSSYPSPGVPPSGVAVWTNGVMAPTIVQADPSKAATYTSKLVLGTDGSLHITRTHDGKTEDVWSTAAIGAGSYKLLVQNDQNVVIYAGSTAKWSSQKNGPV